jgi:hypothetical protein
VYNPAQARALELELELEQARAPEQALVPPRALELELELEQALVPVQALVRGPVRPQARKARARARASPLHRRTRQLP